MVTSPVLRPAGPADAEAMAGIYAPYVRHSLATFEEEAPDAAEMARRLAAIRAAGLPWLVAEVDGKPAGYAYAGPYRSRHAYRYTVEDSVYVAEAARGRGLGKALIAALIAECSTGGWRQMVAVIGDSANRASIAVHERQGFRTIGTLAAVGFKLGRWADTVLMQRPLGSSDEALPDRKVPGAS